MELNLKFYKGDDLYSDGDIEDIIVDYTSKYEDGKYDEVFKTDLRWPIFYHLSSIRQNIINWYPIEKDAEVLEIGSGMGAVTSAICDKAKKVTCVDLSKRRSTCNANRNKNRDNLELIVGNLNDVYFDKKFDYITLIGVFEYASLYTYSDNPYIDFLNNIKKFLKEDGKLLIAIENKFGMKYFAGAPEDHTSKKYDGIVGYENKKGVQTFGKKELKGILEEVGFKYTNFYYPLPDYKLPNIIFSDKYLPTENTIENYTPYYYEGTEIEFDEKEAYKQAIKNGVFDIFANSFFVETSSKELLTKVDLSKQELNPISDISSKFYDKDYSKKEVKVQNASEVQNQNSQILDSKHQKGQDSKHIQTEEIQELENLKKQVENLKLQNEILTNNLKTIEKSASWKITKPLREFNKIFKK